MMYIFQMLLTSTKDVIINRLLMVQSVHKLYYILVLQVLDIYVCWSQLLSWNTDLSYILVCLGCWCLPAVYLLLMSISNFQGGVMYGTQCYDLPLVFGCRLYSATSALPCFGYEQQALIQIVVHTQRELEVGSFNI